MDAFVGNPPFAGKNQITSAGGPLYVEWLQTIHPRSHGNADLVAHFFRRADALLGKHGALGLIATNTIAQGDTRATGLQALAATATSSTTPCRACRGPAMPRWQSLWCTPPRAARPSSHRRHTSTAPTRPRSTRGCDPSPSAPTRSRSARTPAAASSAATSSAWGSCSHPRSATSSSRATRATRAHLPLPRRRGAQHPSAPGARPLRHLVRQMSLEEAERWPDLVAIVREKVKPERDRNKRESYRKYWWHYGEKRPDLYATIAPLDRCLANSASPSTSSSPSSPPTASSPTRLYVYPSPPTPPSPSSSPASTSPGPASSPRQCGPT
jgi:hypothetical protein